MIWLLLGLLCLFWLLAAVVIVFVMVLAGRISREQEAFEQEGFQDVS